MQQAKHDRELNSEATDGAGNVVILTEWRTL